MDSSKLDNDGAHAERVGRFEKLKLWMAKQHPTVGATAVAAVLSVSGSACTASETPSPLIKPSSVASSPTSEGNVSPSPTTANTLPHPNDSPEASPSERVYFPKIDANMTPEQMAKKVKDTFNINKLPTVKQRAAAYAQMITAAVMCGADPESVIKAYDPDDVDGSSDRYVKGQTERCMNGVVAPLLSPSALASTREAFLVSLRKTQSQVLTVFSANVALLKLMYLEGSRPAYEFTVIVDKTGAPPATTQTTDRETDFTDNYPLKSSDNAKESLVGGAKLSNIDHPYSVSVTWKVNDDGSLSVVDFH